MLVTAHLDGGRPFDSDFEQLSPDSLRAAASIGGASLIDEASPRFLQSPTLPAQWSGLGRPGGHVRAGAARTGHFPSVRHNWPIVMPACV